MPVVYYCFKPPIATFEFVWLHFYIIFFCRKHILQRFSQIIRHLYHNALNFRCGNGWGGVRWAWTRWSIDWGWRSRRTWKIVNILPKSDQHRHCEENIQIAFYEVGHWYCWLIFKLYIVNIISLVKREENFTDVVDFRAYHSIFTSYSNLAMHFEQFVLPISFNFPHHFKLPIRIQARLL